MLRWIPTVLGGLSLVICMAGCTGGGGEYHEVTDSDIPKNLPAGGHDHEHAPHGGEVLELAQGHGEVVLEPDHTLTLYLLDDEVKNPAPRAQATVHAELTIGGETQTFELAARPLDGEAALQSSRFQSASPLPESIRDIEDVKGKFTIKSGEQTDTARLEHHHD